MPVVLADLTVLVVFAVALALTIMCIALTKALFGVTGSVLGKLPVVGGWIDATGHHIEQRITNVLGAVALKLEAGIGATWHSSARLIDWIGREINRHAGLLALIASLLAPLGAIAGLARDIYAARHLIGRLVHRLEGIGHDLGKWIGHVERGIGADVLPRIRTLEREITRDFAKERARARTEEKKLNREIAHLWRWARSHPWTVVTDAFVGAVAIALARLGLGWIRCPTAKQVFNRRGCNFWNDLEALVVAGTAVAAGMSLVELAKAEQEVIEDVSAVVRRFWQV